MKKCYIIADPNGAGKTTFAKTYLPNETDCLNFINADLIAEGGHNVPEDIIRRRFNKGWNNFQMYYKQLADI